MILSWMAANGANIICIILVAVLVLWFLLGKKGEKKNCGVCSGKCNGTCGMCAVYKTVDKKEEGK